MDQHYGFAIDGCGAGGVRSNRIRDLSRFGESYIPGLFLSDLMLIGTTIHSQRVLYDSQVSLKRKSRVIPTLLVLPYLVFMFFCGIIPIVYGILEVRNPSWINMEGGYETFIKVFQDFRVGPAIVNVLFLLALFVPLMIVTVLAVSLLLDSVEFKYNNAMRLLFLIPGLIPTAVAVLFWSSVVGYDVVWDKSNIRWFIGVIAFSTGIGSWIVIQYGSLRSISHEVLEAGIVDGCNRFQLAWRLKLPMISKYVGYMVILLIVNALQIFNEPNLLISTNMTTDWSLSQIAFSYAFKNADFAGGSALSIMMLIPNVILALLFVFNTDFLKKTRDTWR